MLTIEDGTVLVKAARKAFFTYFDHDKNTGPPQHIPIRLMDKIGAYVRVGRFAEHGRNESEMILGFTGYPMPYRSLYQSVIDASVAIAVRTYSRPSEEREISFEVTVLSPPEALKAAQSIHIADRLKIDRDALMVASGFRKAIILPQTATGKCRNEAELLGEACMAVGLMADAWLTKTSPEIGLYRFEAQIFRETGAEKDVIEISFAR